MRRGTKGFNVLKCLFLSFLQHMQAVECAKTEPLLSPEAEEMGFLGSPHAPDLQSWVQQDRLPVHPSSPSSMDRPPSPSFPCRERVPTLWLWHPPSFPIPSASPSVPARPTALYGRWTWGGPSRPHSLVLGCRRCSPSAQGGLDGDHPEMRPAVCR